MGIFYCKCLNCNHTGNINLPDEKHTGNFICSECQSKNIITVYRNSNDNEGTHNNIVRSYDNSPQYDEYFYNQYKDKIFAEERQVDAMMMGATGWEDDKELQDNTGIFSYDFLEEDGLFYGVHPGVCTAGKYTTNASQFKPILIDAEVEEFLKKNNI